MPCSLARKAIIFLLTQSLSLPLLLAQQPAREETRPRRTQAEWPQPTPNTSLLANTNLTSIVGPEPTIRVALLVDARSAVVSTTSQLLTSSGPGSTMLATETSRVRLEPRVLSPLPAAIANDGFRVKVAGALSREEAEENAREIKKISGQMGQVTFDTDSKAWGLLVGDMQPREEAEELRALLENAGYDASLSGTNTGTPPSNVTQTTSIENRPNTNLRFTARPMSPVREVVGSAGNGPSFSSSAPVSFGSAEEKTAPVRLNDRPYRGRIEVFTNLRGNLTVVNELGLEDYVRGVVANELSPGGYPAIEALKAQAVAARTYAYKNRGQFISQGFDLLPTTRSQVYRGLTSENALSSRAVDETRGLVATYNGEPINALYTSTCGGRTENSENIFNEAIPYLRGHECAAESNASFAPFMISTSRELVALRDDENVPLARDLGLLLVHNFLSLNTHISDAWLSTGASVSEVKNWLANAARVAQKVTPIFGDDVNLPPAFATALTTSVLGDSRGSILLTNADADYLLAGVKDLQEVPVLNRTDLALIIREGYLPVNADTTLRPGQPLSRARALHAIARILETRSLLQMQKANARPASNGQLIVRSSKGKEQSIAVKTDAFLVRQIGERFYPVRSVAIIGGEPVLYHLSADGQIDYLEVKPAPNGAAADRFSPFSNWTKGLSPGQVQARLARAARGIGAITDLRVAARGSSNRVIDLEVIGTSGTAHVRGGRIRSALGLREQLFVIDREYDDSGRITEFVFHGRGWGHGVGMCQVGAYGLAKQGFSFEQILKTYYTGIELTRLY